MPRHTLFASIMMSVVVAGAARAQDSSAAPPTRTSAFADAPTALDARPPRPRTSVGLWLGLSFDASTTSPHSSIDRDLLVFGLRASRPLRVTGATRVSYVVEVTPVMLLANPTAHSSPSDCQPGGYCSYDAASYRSLLAGRLAYGVGLAPLGVELEMGGSDHRLGAVLDLTGGGAYFTGPIPGSTRFNFTAAGGAALQWRTGGGKRLVAGYKLYHMSNGGLGDLNPGFNAQLFYLGFNR